MTAPVVRLARLGSLASGRNWDGHGVVVVQRFRCGSRALGEWINIILWLAASVVFLILSVTVFLPVIVY